MTTTPQPAPVGRVRLRVLGWVVLGGMLGTAARAALIWPWQTEGADAASPAVPVATLLINLAGACALGLVVGVLGPRHPSARSFLGTGVLGGFTTYSAFAVQTATGPLWLSVVLAAVSVLGGVLLAGAGLRAGRALSGRRGADDEPREAE